MIVPVKIPIVSGSDAETNLKNYLENQLRALTDGTRELFTTRISKWRRAYEAQPAEATRTFPFQNASNIVVPLVAIHSDTLLARVMASLFKTKPPWKARVFTSGIENTQELKEAIEEYMEYQCFEPDELNLQAVCEEGFGDCIRYGTVTFKIPRVEQTEEIVVPGNGNALSYQTIEKFSGCRPVKIPFTKFLVPVGTKNLDDCGFCAHIIPMDKQMLQERAYDEVYDREAVKIVLGQPDRTSPDMVESETQTDAGARQSGSYGWQQWDIAECHFKYRWDKHYVKCIVWYHQKSRQILRAFFNYYPVNIFVGARIFYRDDHYYGYGFAEMLSMFQEEASQIHNQRRDNRTVANTRIWRATPGSKIEKGDFKIFPGAVLPADDGELEAMGGGEVAELSVDEEKLVLELTERRSGVNPPMQGSGAGSFSKRGVYSSMGTLSLLQEGNTRTDLNISDMRLAFTRLGRVAFRLDAEFGVEKKLQKFGQQKAALISRALEMMKNNEIYIPLVASTASVNREVEKQNSMMLSQIMARHYQAITNMMQAAGNQMVPPEIKEYIMRAMDSANLLQRSIMLNFGFDQTKEFVPDVPKPQAQPPMAMPPQVPGAPAPPQAQVGAPGSPLPNLPKGVQ